MTLQDSTKHELIEQYRKQRRRGPTILDKHEAMIIVVALGALTAALISGKLSEGGFTGLMGAFMGYTFGRIFNHWQGKE